MECLSRDANHCGDSVSLALEFVSRDADERTIDLYGQPHFPATTEVIGVDGGKQNQLSWEVRGRSEDLCCVLCCTSLHSTRAHSSFLSLSLSHYLCLFLFFSFSLSLSLSLSLTLSLLFRLLFLISLSLSFLSSSLSSSLDLFSSLFIFS